jgi:hypothetical protein
METSVSSDLFTWASLGTLTGLTGATVVITNAAARAFGWTPKWFGLAVALVLCVGLAAANNRGIDEYVLALLNACLVYLTAAGASSAGAAAIDVPKASGAPESTDGGAQPTGFFHRWF